MNIDESIGKILVEYFGIIGINDNGVTIVGNKTEINLAKKELLELFKNNKWHS